MASVSPSLLVPEKLVNPADIALCQIEILFGSGGVSILERRLRFGHVRFHKLLSRGDVAAKAKPLRALLSSQIVQAVIDGTGLARELVRLLFQSFQLI